MSELSGPIARRWGSISAAMVVLTLCAAGAGQDEATSQPETQAPSQPAKIGLESGLKVGLAGNFDIHYRDADLRGVLQLLSTQGRRNIVATKEVTGKVTADLYGVTFKQALEAVLKASGFAYREKDNFIYVGTAEQIAVKRDLSSELIGLSYITAADAKTMIAPLLSKAGTVSVSPPSAVGIASSTTDAGGNSLSANDVLLVVDYRENIDRIKEVLKKLDVKPPQVMIETTILSASIDDRDALGVNFNALAGIDFRELTGTITSIGDPTLASGVINASEVQNRKGGIVASARTEGFSALGTDATGLTIGLLGNRVAMFITALESVTDTIILANPKLLVLNKQRGEVLIVSRQGYRTETTTETGTSEQIEFLETGTKLLVRPFVCKDGYVRMEIHPEESDGTVTGGIPSETATEVTSNVLVRDGHTIVIGGLFREETQNARSQIPLLGNIPYLGVLFRNTTDDVERREIIIFLTPHIVEQTAAEAVGEQFRDNVERFRIGQRKGLRWFARDKLAQTHMRWAKKYLAKGERNWAMWYLDLALSMSPMMSEAIRLKERLSNRAFWADDARMSDTKYIIQRMIMHELGKPVERIIPPRKPRSAAEVEPAVRKAFGIEQRFEDPLPLRALLPSKPKAQLKPGAAATDEKPRGRPDTPASMPTTRKK